MSPIAMALCVSSTRAKSWSRNGVVCQDYVAKKVRFGADVILGAAHPEEQRQLEKAPHRSRVSPMIDSARATIFLHPGARRNGGDR